MSILHSDEQRLIGESARRVCSQMYSGQDLKALLETPGRYDDGFWQACREMGWPALAIPAEYGGLGLGLLEFIIVAEEAGRAVAGAPFLLTSYAAAEAILLAGDEALKSELLPALASGDKIGTLAFAEDTDPVPTDLAATLADGRISGVKQAVVGGAHADIAVVLASRDGVPALGLVDLHDPTVTRDILHTYDNSRGFAHIAFDGTPARVLTALDAADLAWSVLNRVAIGLAAEQAGGADACMELARDYAKTRHAFGQPIGKFQAVKHKIAEMYVANQIAKANCLEAAIAITEGSTRADGLAAAARVSAIKAYDFASREGIQVFGGIGATWASDMHLHLRRARSCAAMLGPRFVWEDRVVAALESGW